MKRIMIALFLQMTILTAFNTPSLSALAIQNTKNDSNQFDLFWTGDETDLYLNIELSKELKFDGTYYTGKKKNGIGCQVTCYPIEGHQITSSEGYLLEKIIFLVEARNSDSPDKVNYKINSQSFYSGVNRKGVYVSTIKESTLKGKLRNPALDLTQDPIFFPIKDGLFNQGVISFKNSFPFSNLN